MLSPFPCSLMVCEWSGKKTQIEKKNCRLFLKRFPACFNLFVLLFFFATPCLAVAVQLCLEWILIKKNFNDSHVFTVQSIQFIVQLMFLLKIFNFLIFICVICCWMFEYSQELQCSVIHNPLQPGVAYLYLLKTSEKP